MNIQIICIGKLKEKYWTEAIQEYAKRLSRFCTLEIIELKEARLPDKASAAEEALVKQEEGREILKAIKPGIMSSRWRFSAKRSIHHSSRTSSHSLP